jgi:hypothetical protein
MSRGGKLLLALGNNMRRTEAGKLAKLSHPVHGILKFLEFALQIKIFQFVTVHMRLEQFRRKHLGAAPGTDRRVKNFIIKAYGMGAFADQ